MNVTLNADDFGISHSVNRAILTCFQQRLISTATVMANMPAFEDAVRLCFANNLVDRVGIHLNLSEGTPLTDEIKGCRTFCDSDGQFLRRRHYRISKSQQRILAAEVTAQIQRCRNVGLPVSHLDSHHHVHTEPGKFAAILPVLLDMGMESVRPSRNVDSRSRLSPKAVWKRIFNNRLQEAGWLKTQYFGCVKSFEQMQSAGKPHDTTIEIECHPGFDSRGRLVDLVEGVEFHSAFGGVINRIDDGAVELVRRAA